MTIIETRFEKFPRYTTEGPCSGKIVQESSGNYWTKIIKDNPTAHRSKPENLLDFLTIQGRQYEDIHQYGLAYKPPAVGSYEFCNGAYMPVLHSEERWFTQLKLGAPAPSTNWPLQLRLNIKSHSQNLGTALAEYRQTANMFSSFAKGTYNAWKIFRGKLPRNSRLTPCTVAAADLTATYGLNPLMSDLAGSLDKLLDRLDRPIVRRVRGSGFDRRTFSENGVEGTWTTSERATAYITYVPEGPSDFTFGNPLEIAWEVVPFSFVVDWGFGIGDFLSSLDALKDVQSTKGVVVRKEWYYHEKPFLDGYDFKRKHFRKYKSHMRSIFTEVPLPSAPTWNPSRSWRTIKNGLSLLVALNQRCQK